MSGSSRFSQLASASRASSAGGMTSKQRPVRALTRARKSSPLQARRQASVAMWRARRDAMALDLGGADVQRLERAIDRVAAQRPAQRHPLAQPDRPGIGVDDLEALDRRPRHQEPAVVGAEIDGGESVREPAAVPASLVPPCWGVDSPAIWNSFLGAMVTQGGGRGETPWSGVLGGSGGKTLDTGASNVSPAFRAKLGRQATRAPRRPQGLGALDDLFPPGNGRPPARWARAHHRWPLPQSGRSVHIQR